MAKKPSKVKNAKGRAVASARKRSKKKTGGGGGGGR
jgi:hypothetical protein